MIYILIHNNNFNNYYFLITSHIVPKKTKKKFPWKNTDSAMLFQYSCTFSSLFTQRPLR